MSLGLGGLKVGGKFGWFVVAPQTANQRGRTTMDDATIIDFRGRDTVTDSLTDRLREGARDFLLQAAVEAERDAFLVEFAKRRTADGRVAVVRSRYHPERAVQTGIGPVTVKVPKVPATSALPTRLQPACRAFHYYRDVHEHH